jgi:acyl carrier protein
MRRPEDATLEELQRMVARELEIARPVAPDDDLVQALGLDSITRSTLVIAVEDHFRVALPDDALAEVRTLADLARLIARERRP